MDRNRLHIIEGLRLALKCAKRETELCQNAYDDAVEAVKTDAITRSVPDCSAELALVTAATTLEQAELMEYHIAQAITMAAQMAYDECITGP